MSCNKYSDLISLYVDNELEEGKEELLAHLEECEECKKEYEELLELKNKLSTLVKESDRSLSDEVMRKINKKKTPFIFRHIGVAASLVVIALLAVFTMGEKYTQEEDTAVNNSMVSENAPSIKNSLDTAPLEKTEYDDTFYAFCVLPDAEESVVETESMVALPEAPKKDSVNLTLQTEITEITINAELEDVIDNISEHFTSYTVDENVITVEVSLSDLLQVLDFTPTKTVGSGQRYVKIIVE